MIGYNMLSTARTWSGLVAIGLSICLTAHGQNIVPNSAYEISVNWEGGIALPADLVITPTIDTAPQATTNNGVNPVDVGIFTRASPLVGNAGALWFGTNTSLSAIKGSKLLIFT